MTDTAQVEDASPPIDVGEPTRTVLLALVDGWSPEEPALSAVETLEYGSHQLSELCSTVALNDGRLVATLGGPRFHLRLRELLPLSLDDVIRGTLADGTVLEARGVTTIRLQGHAQMTVEASEWSLRCAEAPLIWIGRVENPKEISFGGNMIVEHVRDDGLRLGRRNQFRFAGVYTYFLLQTGGSADTSWNLIVDAPDFPPNREVLEREFLILQFVLGRQLHVGELLGLDSCRRTIAAMSGAGTRSNLLSRSYPPVPIGRTAEAFVDDAWSPVLFERIAELCTTRPEARRPVAMALDSYLDSMTLHVDADYLRLQVALEAFAYWTLRLTSGEERSIVKDKAAWKDWLRENASTILGFAAPGFENNLYSKVGGVHRLSSGRVVPSAFLEYATSLLAQMTEELEGRDVVAHQGLMAPDGYVGPGELERIALVRTMLVGLIGKVSGYAGAINGWLLDQMGYPVQPEDWWTVDQKARAAARVTYVAEGPEAGRTSKPDT